MASLVLILLTLSSCIKEDLSDCPLPFNVRVRVLDADQQDITTSGEIGRAMVFVFDQEGKKIEQIEMSAEDIVKKAPIRLKKYDFKTLTFVVWANMSDRMYSESLGVQRIEDLKMKLLSQEGVAEIAPKLYSGFITIPVRYGDIVDDKEKVVDISPRTAQVRITIIGYEQWFYRTKTESLQREPLFKVGELQLKETPDTYTALNELGGDKVKYYPEATLEPSGDLITPVFTIYPTLNEEPLELSLWTAGDPIFKVKKASDGTPLIPIPGRMLNVLIDLKNASINVLAVVTPWNVVHQFVVY